jgi:hypothetical protein
LKVLLRDYNAKLIPLAGAVEDLAANLTVSFHKTGIYLPD